MTAALGRILTIFQLTLHEAARRRILTAALIGGLAFLVLFSLGLHFSVAEFNSHTKRSLHDVAERALVLNLLTLAGLYAVNFLTVMSAVLLPLDTLAGEIASGVIQTLASKPVRRGEILLGKWLAYVLVVNGYLLLLAGGVLLSAHLFGAFTPPGWHIGLPLMMLEAVLLVTLSIAGGTRLSTVTNGVVGFGLFGLAFIGNWVEQIGAFTGNIAARNVGTVASLILPSESMWQLAAFHMQPSIMSSLHVTPFSPASVPSPLMVWWCAIYIAALLAFALRSFAKRPL